MEPQERLILFLKNPTTGRVKTRLAAGIGAEAARQAYTAMVEDLLEGLRGISEMIVPFVDPAGAEEPAHPVDSGEESAGAAPGGSTQVGFVGADFPWLHRFDQAPQRQRGAELGRRMAHAFEDLWERYPGCDRAVLIGSDIPTIDADLIRAYMIQLRSLSLVLGPSADGGYYLIGFQRNRYTAELFQGLSWSTDRVLDQTRKRAEALGMDCYLGRTLNDIDNLEDLQETLQNNRSLTHLQHWFGLKR